MKNKFGMKRSKEFMKAHEAHESSAEKVLEKETGKEERGNPELHHIRVHMANEQGEVKVTHHAGPNTAPMATHTFKGEELAEHIMEHSGAAYSSEGGGEHYADEKEAVEA